MSNETNPVAEARQEHQKYTVADSMYEFSTGITFTAAQLKKIQDTAGGCRFPLSELIDGFPEFEKRLKKLFTNQYAYEDPSKYMLNFLVMDVAIYDIKSPNPFLGMSFGGSLTFPAIHGCTMPMDELTDDGQHKKVLDIGGPHHFIDGREHAFTHTMKHESITDRHVLLTPLTRLNETLAMPKTQSVEGSGGSIGNADDKTIIDYVKNKRNGIMLHGHMINNVSAYPTEDHKTTVTESISGGKGGNVTRTHVVALRHGGLPAGWFTSDGPGSAGANSHSAGVMHQIEEYAYTCFHFIDSLNESRAVNFNTLGLWVDIDHLKLGDVPKIKATMSFKILPIVPFHDKKSKDFIPWNNFTRHLMNVLKKVDKPFDDETKK